MFHTISYKELFPEKRQLSDFIPIYRDSHVVLQYSSEGGQALTWLGFFLTIGIGRARVIFPAGSETSSLCIQKKSNYISVIALSLKTAAIGFYPDLSGLLRCWIVLLYAETASFTRYLIIHIQKKSNYISVIALSLKTAAIYSPTLSCSTIDVIGLNFSVRNGKRWNPNAKTTWIRQPLQTSPKGRLFEAVCQTCRKKENVYNKIIFYAFYPYEWMFFSSLSLSLPFGEI